MRARRMENAEGCLLRSSSAKRAGAQDGLENAGQRFAAAIERAELDAAVPGNDFERRAGRGDVPARVPAGILVSRRKVDATVAIEVAQQVHETLAEGGFRKGAGDLDPVGSGVAICAHGFAPWVIEQDNRRGLAAARRGPCRPAAPAAGRTGRAPTSAS